MDEFEKRELFKKALEDEKSSRPSSIKQPEQPSFIIEKMEPRKKATEFSSEGPINTNDDTVYTDNEEYVFVAPSESRKTVRTVLLVVLCVVAAVMLAVGIYSLVASFMDESDTNDATSATNYTLEKSTGSNMTIQDIIKKNEDSVVEITTESVSRDSWMQQYVTGGAGSGIIVDPAGYIATNNHVISGASKVTVRLHNGESYQAQIIGADSVNDVAVLKISASDKLPAVTYGDSNDLQVGDLAVAIGNPLGQLGGTATSGIISALDRELTIENQVMNLLQTDAPINPGNSGGGLFNGDGNLIGMVVAKSSGSNVEGLGFAIPVNTVAETVKQLIENGKITGRPAAGITVTDVDASTAMQNGLRMTGVYITEVNGSNAQQAGLKQGDFVYYIDDKEIDTTATLKQVIQSHKVGDTVKFTVIRNGKTVECNVKLEDSTNFDTNNTQK